MATKYFNILEGICIMTYKETRSALMAIACEQGGFFTARQALSVGYAYPEQTYHTAQGDWVRIARGIYRLRGYPSPEREDLIILSLMSHDRSGQAQAVVSHETALAIHELGDANPLRIHLTVPRGFRRRMPAEVVLHRGQLMDWEWEEYEGYRVTTPSRTLLDIAASPASWPYLEAAMRDALARGMVRSRQLLAADMPEVVRMRLAVAMETAEGGGQRTRR
jgi:predicted transcriptional regulator of viral defense system